MPTIRLAQLELSGMRRVALVDEPQLRLLTGVSSVYDLALEALGLERPLAEHAATLADGPALAYDDVLAGADGWRVLPAGDHPLEPARCLVSGTGLTHMGSAARRNAMHAQDEATMTDSMRMFRWGIEGGCPAPGEIGTSPEWFYKGDGQVLRGCGEPLLRPWFAEDGGEEPEVAGVYLIAPDGQPFRLGFAVGNEFSDHKYEKRNYLCLASSKLRECSLGPELVVGDAAVFAGDVPGVVRVERGGAALWSAEIHTGEASMCHSLANIEHHHFKFPQHRRPGDIHVHFFGADAFSFGSGIELQAGDVMHVEFRGFGRPLRNPVAMEPVGAERGPVLVRTA